MIKTIKAKTILSAKVIIPQIPQVGEEMLDYELSDLPIEISVYRHENSFSVPMIEKDEYGRRFLNGRLELIGREQFELWCAKNLEPEVAARTMCQYFSENIGCYEEFLKQLDAVRASFTWPSPVKEQLDKEKEIDERFDYFKRFGDEEFEG